MHALVLVVQPDGSGELAYLPVDPALRMTWRETQVGGFVETVRLAPNGLTAYRDAAGKLKGAALNICATEMAHVSGWRTNDVMVGPVVFAGVIDGEDVSVPQSLLELADAIGLNWSKTPHGRVV